jgi:hypothetical protein
VHDRGGGGGGGGGADSKAEWSSVARGELVMVLHRSRLELAMATAARALLVSQRSVCRSLSLALALSHMCV